MIFFMDGEKDLVIVKFEKEIDGKDRRGDWI